MTGLRAMVPVAVGTVPLRIMVSIWVSVKLPNPLWSGVRLRVGNRSPLGSTMKFGLPARYLVGSGVPSGRLGV
jgi:hypothetical protein